ncbi:MAG: aminotransferase class IV, partial [Chitinophagaceae bacterium]
MNEHERIADAGIANVFLIKNKTIITPPLIEGCVGGVMRKYLLEKIGSTYKIKEEPITIDMVLEADELFLTNAVKGIRWVKQFRNKTYQHTQTVEIYNGFVKTIWG